MCTDVCTCGRSKLELGLLVLQDFLPEQLQSQRKKSYSYSCKGRRATATSAKEELHLQRKKRYICKGRGATATAAKEEELQLHLQRKNYSCKGRRATATSAKEELQLQRKKSYSCKAKRGDGLQFIQYRTVPANNTYAPSDQTGNSDEHVSFLRVRCKSMRFV